MYVTPKQVKEHKKQQQYFHMVEEHVLNINFKVTLMSFVFTDIQRVKTGLFYKCNSVSLTCK